MLLGAEVHVVCNNISGEGDDRYAKPRKKTSEHGATCKDWVIAPCLAFCPRISVKGEI